ncbi:MAG TPA: 2-oxo-4-hydroxy-4-carboxy-5-ureidoimidazoline decarboxylase [Pyrinomonadaceae bacterium]|nr:2-oxo-4-hydroxy-4-carboxy-5-ureidoimidazoline decarboxylase [Pyrinomonadaceae bacterium]
MENSRIRPRAVSHLQWLNSLPNDQAVTELKSCCGSSRWAAEVVSHRPFTTIGRLIDVATEAWWQLEPADWLEAFRSHPKIGQKKAATSTSGQSKAWSRTEQSGMREASAETAAALAKLNEDYEARFGHIFIVCATGKSSEEMLAILRERLENEPDDELQIAAAEQAKITELRLKKLIDSP